MLAARTPPSGGVFFGKAFARVSGADLARPERLLAGCARSSLANARDRTRPSSRASKPARRLAGLSNSRPPGS